MVLLTAFCVFAVFTLPFALGDEREGNCKYYAKKMMAKTMECYLIMGNPDPVCEAGVSSNKYCRIEVRGQEMCIKWLKSSDIRCENETFSKGMEGTPQDCAADQASDPGRNECLDCAKEFSTSLDNDAAITAVPGHQNSAPTIKAGHRNSALRIKGDLMVVVLSLLICIWFLAP